MCTTLKSNKVDVDVDVIRYRPSLTLVFLPPFLLIKWIIELK